MKELLEEFISESKEHLSTIEDDFLELEQQKDNPDDKLVNKIFRAIHTIKGTSGFFGLETITSLSHTMENILSLIRNGEMVPTSDIIDTLLTGADIINTLIDDIDHSNEFDITDILGKLNTILEGDGKLSESLEEMELEVDLKDSKGNTIGFKIDLFELNSVLANYKYLYLLKFDLNEIPSYGVNSPVKLIQKLLKNGLIADAQTTTLDEDLSALPIGPLFYEIVYATNFQKTTISKRFKLNDEEIIELDQNFAGAIPREEKEDIIEIVDEPISQEVAKVEQKIAVVKQPKKSTKSEIVKVDNKLSTKVSASTKKLSGETSVRIQVDLLDKLMRLAGELVLIRNQQVLITGNQSSSARKNSQRLDLVTTELQEAIMMTRMQPAGNIFNKFHRVVRDIGKNLNKQIEIHISGNEVELDKTILESLADPLTHIIRNSCDHGIESPEVREAAGKTSQGNIWLSAFHEGGQINIQIKDDGKGIDPDVIRIKAFEKNLKTEEELDAMSDKEISNLVMLAGFSTAEQVSSISGRGVGMDVVREGIERLNGSIELESVKGEGTTLNLRLPLTLAIIPSLIIRIGEQRYAVPQVNLEELVTLYDDDVNEKIERANDLELFRLRETLLPMVRLNEVLLHKEKFTAETRSSITEKYYKQSQNNNSPKTLSFAVLKVGTLKFGLIVDEVVGTEEIVVKPMHSINKSISIYTGATIMGDGSVALILDADGIAKHTGVTTELAEEEDVALTMKNYQHVESQTILLFKNGAEEQFAVALPLIRRIEKIRMKDIEQIGHKEFITVDNISTKILRLDHILSVSPAEESEEAFLLLPKHIHRPFGILATSLVDIENSTIDLNTESYSEDGLLGTSITHDKMTLFIDIYRLIELSEPEWFADRRLSSAEHNEIKRVLLLEDSSFFKELVKGYLVSEGYEVDTVENGLEGLQKIQEVDYDYDIIVSDIEMPEMNGIEFIKEVRKEESTKNTLALALSSLGSDLDKMKASDAGFDRYEVKMERELFLTTISEMLNG
ncbi:MAG: hybrid sensor histidine kinase/response regulator [Melioribacteraceae bacterium]|nr:hybrid sensor histidine kinase/response regulator [Melioribacteraceae bacterium]